MIGTRRDSAGLLGLRLVAVITAAALVLGSDFRAGPAGGPERDGPALSPAALITGPMARLLESSTDLGPSRTDEAQLTAALHDSGRPEALFGWARSRDLSVRWRPGDQWAIVDGAPRDVASAFGVAVHDYRGRRGQVFYASAQQPSVPAPVRGVVTALGRILGYSPHHLARTGMNPLDVPREGLTPAALLRTYHADALAAAGFTGKGTTIVFFEFDGYHQADLDSYAALSGLPKFTPTLIGGQPGPSNGEAVMDLEVAHGIAPDAHLVVVNALPTVEGDGAYEKIAHAFELADGQFPGAVWSSSVGWGCDKLVTAADLVPVQSALAIAESHGTSAFDASGDTGGLECKGGDDWSSAPGPDDVGLDAVASLPAMTNVGGTTLSTDAHGKWLSEQAWQDSPLSQGTGGGVSALFARPDWQNAVSVPIDSAHRLTPDIAATADPFTGVKIIIDQQTLVGGGTSQSTPIWAGLTALMDEYLHANGGHALGDLNPLLYRVAAGANRPGFHDVTLGGNAVDSAGPGFDLVSGLGTPDVDNLVRDLLDIQKGVAPQ
jgi:kumamolisin